MSKLDRINSFVIWLNLSHTLWYSSGLSSIPMKRAASSRFVKLLVMTRLLSCVSAGSVVTCTFSWSRHVLARLPCSLQVTTTCRYSGSVSSSNSTAPLLSGLSPDLAKETSKPGLPGGNAFPPNISSDPPLIDSVQIPNSFCSGRHTHSAAYSELPDPVSARLRIPATSCFRPSLDAISRSQVRSQVQGCWQLSFSVWK